MELTAARAALAADTSLVGRDLCRAYSDLVDTWLAELLAKVGERVGLQDVSLVAVGGYGRAELSLHSDIDVLLLHRGRSDIGTLADGLWYPIWDEGLKLGHAVRTVREALALASDDLDTATSLLQVRHLAGDEGLTEELAGKAIDQWQKRAKRWLADLSGRVRARHEQAGEVAFLLEPDLKEGRGGLRDVHALRWAEAARSLLWEGDDPALVTAYETLLSTRGRAPPAHRAAGGPPAAPGAGRRRRRAGPGLGRRADAGTVPGRSDDRVAQRRRLAAHRRVAGRPAGLSLAAGQAHRRGSRAARR